MATNYIVQAKIIDINSDIPQPSDIFFVDTNIWYLLTCAQPLPKKVVSKAQAYSNYINQAIKVKASLHRCGLCLPELAHSIERAQRKIFMEHNQIKKRPFTKEYRHNYPSERARITQEIKSAWGTVETLTEPVDVLVDENLTNDALSVLCSCPVDGYDTFLIEAMKNSGVVQIITDDGDFSTVPNIRVFTINKAILHEAQNQGKLITR